jgi:hypothetical protein
MPTASIQTTYPMPSGPLAGKLVFDKPLYLSGSGPFTFTPGFKAGTGTATNVTGGLSNLVFDGFGAMTTRSSDNLPYVWKHNLAGDVVQDGSIHLASTDGMTWVVDTNPQMYWGRVDVSGSMVLSLLSDFTHNGTVGPAGEHAFVISGSNRSITKLGRATLFLNGDQGYAPESSLNVSVGTVRFGSDPGAGWIPGKYSLDGSGNVTVGPQAAPNLNVRVVSTAQAVFAAPLCQIALLSLDDTARASIESPSASSSRTLYTRSLSLANKAVQDLADQQMAIDYTGTSPLASVRSWIISAYSPTAAAHWGGTGVTSTAAATNASHGLGYGEAASLLNLGPTNTANFMGATVDASTVLVRYTLAGDSDLDGDVDIADVAHLAQNYGATSAANWSQGDFNYDGAVNFADVVRLAQNYGSSATLSVAAAVPEPVAIAPALLMLLSSRRRRTSV